MAHRSKKSGLNAAPPVITSAPALVDTGWRRVILTLLIGFLGLFPWLRLDGFYYSQSMQFVIATLFGAFLLVILGTGLLLGKLAWPRSNYFWLIGIYAAVFTLASLTSVSPYRSLVGAYGFNADGLLFFGICLLLAAAFLSIVPTGTDIRLILRILLLQAAILSLQTLLEIVQGAGFHIGSRPSTPLYNSDFFLSYALLLLPIGICQAVRGFQTRALRWALTYLGMSALIGLAAFFTLPAGLQSLLSGSGQATVGRTTSTSATPAPSSTPNADFLQSDANNERFSLWKLGWKAGLQKPWLGWGPGTDRLSFYHNAQDLSSWNFNAAPNSYHNDLLDRFSQTGIFGALSYLAILIGLYWTYLRRRPGDPELRNLGFSLLAGISLFLLFNLAAFTTIQTGILFWVLAAGLLSLTGTIRYRPSSYRHWELFPIAASLGLSLYLAGFSINFHRAESQAIAGQAALASHTNVGLAALDYREATVLAPHEDGFFRQSAANAFYSYVSLAAAHAPESRLAPYKAQALQDSQTMLDLNPTLPQNQATHGEILYYLSEPGSAAENQAFQEMAAAVHEVPYDELGYRIMTQAYSVKNGPSALPEPWKAALFDGTPTKILPRLNYLLTSQGVVVQ